MNPIRGRESVCRSLFGPVDHEQLRRDLKQKLREMSEEDTRRWNFNFQADAPLPGRFQWEEIPADCASAVYQERAPPRRESACASSPEEDRLSDREDGAAGGADQENCSSISNTRKTPTEVTPVRRKRAHPTPAAKPRNTHYARITDFFAKRRKSTETKSLNHFHTSDTSSRRTIR